MPDFGLSCEAYSEDCDFYSRKKLQLSLYQTAKVEVERLVERFSRDYERFRHPHYNEAQVRIEFVNPFFRALGWNVENSLHVVHETRVIVDDRGEKRVKHPDYGFHTGRDIRFYVEAKKPSVNLQSDPEPAYQVRRYGWSRSLPLSVLTDFEEFIVYNCLQRPFPDDGPHVARLRYINYSQYLAQWDDIFGLFSLEAVLDGALERFVEEEKPKGTVTVDNAFLQELELWRELLAKDIAARNPALTRRQLNIAVQRTIDRLVFLRIAEDRNIEPYGRLNRVALHTPDIYDGLKRLYAEANDKYNSGLFHFTDNENEGGDAISSRISVGDEVLETIITNLYYPQSPYEFSVLPAAILGQVYERFLGSVIVLENGKASVEEKPDVRKAGGVYYTPTYIVDYIVENTVGRLLEGKNPNQVAELRILDPACGSGSFLIGAYQNLIDWHLSYYVERIHENPNSTYRSRVREASDPSQDYVLTVAEKKRILLNNLYGVDLDQQAVEVTKLSLLLKMLENETSSTATQYAIFGTDEQLLPDLANNIKWGNSLIGSDFYAGKQLPMFADEEIYRVKAFDWDSDKAFGLIMRNGGFDVVIGNPPYIDSEWMTRHYPEERDYMTGRFTAASGNWDIFCVFIEKAIRLCRDGGYSSMIVPNKLGAADYAEGARTVITTKNQLTHIRDYSHVPVFPVAVYPIVYLARRTPPDFHSAVELEKMKHVKGGLPEIEARYQLEYERYFSEPENAWRVFVHIQKAGFIERMDVSYPQLSELASVLGAATVSEAYEIKPLISDIEPRNPSDLKMVNSGTIDRYRLLWGERALRYLKDGYTNPVIETANHSKLPVTRLKQAKTPKIIVAGMTKILECGVDIDGTVLAGKSTVIVIPHRSDELLYLLAILNSSLINYWYNTVYGGNKLGGGYLRIGRSQIASIPIRTSDFENSADEVIVDRVIRVVQTMLNSQEQLAKASGATKEVIEQQIARADREIDALVYELYGLTAAEIAMVEGRPQISR